MSFATGARRGPYEIQRPLGAGGMGEVYCARDTRLGRDVAIKVLPATLAPDPDRLARFRREAQLLAALNHPNIAAIYGLEESDDALHLVMELVEGPTLAERIAQGPIPLAEALAIARQIAEGLEYAHERGIIHRDLKPANIKVTPDDKVKILDFGLAKAVEDTPGETASVANSPTLSMAATKVGVILGTAGYMAPEQVRGKTADRRADIWAFGVVLFEMLTGRQLYTGSTASDVLASVIKDSTPWEALPVSTPPPIQKLLRRCLEKDPTRRLRDIGEARIAIEEYVADPAGASVVMTVAPAAERPRRAVLPWVAATGVLALALVMVAFGWWRATRRTSAPLIRFNVDIGLDASLNARFGGSVLLSPDGTRLAYLASGADGKSRIVTRLMDQNQAVVLAGTDNARSPFFSPDGQWIAFFADDKLKKVSALGGATVTLCDAADNRGGSWGADGNIVFGVGSGTLLRVSFAGGTPSPVLPLANGEHTQRWPQVLPGSNAVLFTSAASRGTFDDANIEVFSWKTGQRKTLHRGGMYARFVPSGPGASRGHLLYVHQTTLFAAPLDMDRLELAGPAAPLLENVAANDGTGGAHFAFSETGIFSYVEGMMSSGWQISWLDAAGKLQPMRRSAGLYFQPRISPDGTRLAVASRENGNLDVWVYAWDRDTMTRLTFSPGGDSRPVWRPDGKFIAFASDSGGAQNLYWVRADGGGQVQRLTQSPNGQFPYSFSPDGKRLAYSEQFGETSLDIWTIPLDVSDDGQVKPGKPEVFLQTKASEFNPAFSPDGKWMAYTSAESGMAEIYVRPFPGPGGKWQVSSGGGLYPVWSRTARELFYRSYDGRVMVAGYKPGIDSFTAEGPRLWADKLLHDPGPTPNLDIAPDGKRLVVFPQESIEDKSPKHVIFLLNFFDELHRRIPAGRK